MKGLLYQDIAGIEEEHLSTAEKEAGVKPASDYWNPDKTWQVDVMDEIAEVLSEHGLAPEQPEPLG